MEQPLSNQEKRTKAIEGQLRKEISMNQIKINQLLKRVDRKALFEHISLLL